MMRSFLDNDLYKCTMAYAAWKLYPKAIAKSSFINRNTRETISTQLTDAIKARTAGMEEVRLTTEEAAWLRLNCPELPIEFINWLYEYEFDHSSVFIRNYRLTNAVVSEGLNLDISGLWHREMLWEVILLSIIAEEMMAAQGVDIDLEQVEAAAEKKAIALAAHDCYFVELGTRRRYSYAVQKAAISGLIKGGGKHFLGTSNMHFAMLFGLKVFGTVAHEWTQAISGLVGLRHANRFALDAWNSVYNGALGIALTDTFGSKAFFDDFDLHNSKLYDGVRNDSGNPCEFTNDTLAHYNSKRIKPATKKIIFSNALNLEKCFEIREFCGGAIGSAYGIGGFFTNDIPGITPPNIVIKLQEIDDIKVVKLSDDVGKESGDPEAVANARWTFGR